MTVETRASQLYLEAIPAEEVKRVRDAHGALCLDCGAQFDVSSPVPWSWRRSQLMHERGTRHHTIMFRYT